MTPNNGGSVLQQSEGRSPPELSGGVGGGHLVDGNKSLKKGPWTAAEDQILMEYVRKHGEGNWNSVQRNSGLNRCGKSCRLRWANHLRPNLKKGSFSPEEERLILELHAKYGNKWARMASQLPGRTDNEIKNYWNTRVKRRQRQGLPLYPHDIKQSQTSHSHSRSHSVPNSLTIPTGLNPHTTTIQNPLQPTINGPSPSPTFFFQIQSPPTQTPPSLSPLSSPQHPKLTHHTSLPLFDPTANTTSSSSSSFTFHRPSPILGVPLRYKRYRESAGLSPPISPTPQRSASIYRTSSMPDVASFQLGGTNPMPETATFQFQRSSNLSFPPLPRSQFDYSESLLSSSGSVYSLKSELPSKQVSQTESHITIDTKVTSAAAASANHNSCGLLENLLQEAEALASGDGNSINSRRDQNGLLGSFEEKHTLDGYGRWLQSTTSINGSLLEAKPVQDDHLNSMPEDLSKLFSFIPSMETVSDWYSDSGEFSNGHSSGVTDTGLDFDMQHMAALFPGVGATAEHGRAASTSWDNLPGIC